MATESNNNNQVMQIGSDNYKEVIKEIEDGAKKTDLDINKNWEEYNGEHEILKRPPKELANGNTEERTKVVCTYQKKIVESAVSFLFGAPVQLESNAQKKQEKEAFSQISSLWKKLKLDYHNRDLARKLAVETKVAEFFYPVKDKRTGKTKIKSLIFSHKDGDEIYPEFDDYGDMVAFLRKYKTTNEAGEEVEAADIYTATKIYSGIKSGSGWEVVEKENVLGKIPVVYYEQENAEWEDVQSSIDRIEKLKSNFGDTNDYFGDPILLLKGNVKNMLKKDEKGKTLQIKGEKNTRTGSVEYNGGAEILSWDHAPDSVNMESQMLKDDIFGLTDTPDLSFNNVKGMSAVSGVTLRFMFMGALLKAKNKEEVVMPGLERRISLLKACLTTVDRKLAKPFETLEISFSLGSVLPHNSEEIINSLMNATGGKQVLSQKTGVQKNPMVDDPEEELKTIQDESSKSQVNDITESYF